MTQPAEMAAEIRRAIPNIYSGSLCIFGEIFGGRIDNIHRIVTASSSDENNCLVIQFDHGEQLIVWDPVGLSVSAQEFLLEGASKVRWQWNYDSNAAGSEPDRCIEYRWVDKKFRAGQRVQVLSTDSPTPHHITPGPTTLAVALIGYW